MRSGYIASFLVFAALVSAQTDTAFHRYLYAASPGCRDYLQYGGHGIVVFDIDHGHKFVKRIPMAGFAANGVPEAVKGISASAITKKLYVSTPTHLMCFDLTTGSMLWNKTYDFGCDRMALSPDGKLIYQPSFENNYWYVLDAATGNEIKRIPATGARSHNTIYGQDGKAVYMAGLGSPVLRIAETVNHTVARTVTFDDTIRPFTINGRQTLAYVNVNGLLGFEIGDIRTGKMIQRVQVPGFKTGPEARHSCPSHGIALTLDESEVWVVDGHNQYVHVFDNTVMPPKLKTSIKTRDFPGWITMSIDGTLAYPSSGDVIDVKSKNIIGGLVDDSSRTFETEKMLEIDFQGNTPVKAGSSFGIGGGSTIVTSIPGPNDGGSQLRPGRAKWNSLGARRRGKQAAQPSLP